VTLAVWSLLFSACDWREDDRLRRNVGKTACNATNGEYRGVITGVEPFGRGWVYTVRDDEGFERKAPPSNVVVGCDRPLQ
jgi:hypothetical protein